MDWRRRGDKPLSEPMMVRLPTQICVTRPQWVKVIITTMSRNKARLPHLPHLPQHWWFEKQGTNFDRHFRNCDENITDMYTIWQSCSSYSVTDDLGFSYVLTFYWNNSSLSLHCSSLKVRNTFFHYNDVIMGAKASQITSLAFIYSTVYSDADQRKHQSFASLAFVRGIHRFSYVLTFYWNNSSLSLHCSSLKVRNTFFHYNDVIMGAMASQITSLTIIYSTVYSDADQREHQSFASMAFVQGIHRWPVNFPHKGPVTRKMFAFGDVIMLWENSCARNRTLPYL